MPQARMRAGYAGQASSWVAIVIGGVVLLVLVAIAFFAARSRATACATPLAVNPRGVSWPGQSASRHR